MISKTTTGLIGSALLLGSLMLWAPALGAADNAAKIKNSTSCYRMQSLDVPDFIETSKLQILGVGMNAKGEITRHILRPGILNALPDNFDIKSQNQFFDNLNSDDFIPTWELPEDARTPLDMTSPGEKMAYYILLPESWHFDAKPFSLKIPNKRWKHGFLKPVNQAVNAKTAYLYKADLGDSNLSCRYEFNLHVTIEQKVKDSNGKYVIAKTPIIIDPGLGNKGSGIP